MVFQGGENDVRARGGFRQVEVTRILLFVVQLEDEREARGALAELANFEREPFAETAEEEQEWFEGFDRLLQFGLGAVADGKRRGLQGCGPFTSGTSPQVVATDSEPVGERGTRERSESAQRPNAEVSEKTFLIRSQVENGQRHGLEERPRIPHP